MLKSKKLLTFILILLMINPVIAEKNNYYVYNVGHLSFISYSKTWNEEMLKQLYLELLNNFHSSEFQYLSTIYIYPDSPNGVNGQYCEDIFIENGEYKPGKNAYIELFNGEKFKTIKDMAPILTHEYGHHYTIYNILNYENIYNYNLKDSEYFKLRNLKNYPVLLSNIEKNYLYHWDIYEILADDYVQLLGSSTAKNSKDYKDVLEQLNLNSQNNFQNHHAFNLKPQINPYLPLAAEVDGLYNYFLKIGGFTSRQNKLVKYPTFKELTVETTLNNELMFKISWTEAVGNGPFEYTIFMYPENNPLNPIPIKTVYDKEDLVAYFGSSAKKSINGKISSVSNFYSGTYIINVFIKDSNNFIYLTTLTMLNFDEFKVQSLITEISTEVTSEIKTFSQNKNNKNNKIKVNKLGPNLNSSTNLIKNNNLIINTKNYLLKN